MKSDRICYFLLSLSAVLFLFLFFSLSYYNRLAVDDFYYLGCYMEKGIWGCMSDLYFGYSARWAAYLFTGWVVSMNGFIFYHFIFNMFTLTCLIAILNLIIRKVFSKNLHNSFSKKRILLFSILLICCLFFSSYSIGETWFWLVQVCTYLWSIIMSLVLLYVLLKEGINALQIFLIIFSSSFIGGAGESYTLAIIFLLIFYLVLSNTSFKKYFPEISFEKRNNKIFTALVFLLISFTITMMGPGNEVRYSALPNADFFDIIWVQIKAFIKIIFIRTPLKLHYLVLFSLPWLVLGTELSSKNKKEEFMSFFKAGFKYFLIVFVLILIFLIPTSFVMVELGPDRSLSQVTFLIVFSFTILFYYVGYKVKISQKVLQTLKAVAAFCIAGVLTFHLITQYPVSKKYALAYDQRMEYLKELKVKQQKALVELEPLPASGMLYSAEISEDTMNVSNYFLEYGLHLPFNTKRKQAWK